MSQQSTDHQQEDVRTRRERELASLYAIARSLTALGDVDDVLDSIVRHAYELIGTDFTYLSLIDDRGELHVTASEGTISAEFRSAHIPPGTGLGGKVIATRAAHWVEDYVEARELRHYPGFDALVGGEGLVALLGVPLVARDRVLGALFAGHRSKRRFHTDEIALLSAFADQAAVALDNARLYEESRAALTELQSAYRTIEDQVAVMERAQSVHETLTGIVLDGGGPEVVAAELAAQLGGDVTILDRQDGPLARSGPDPRAEPDGGTEELDEVVERARSSGRAATTTGTDGQVHTAAAVRAGDSLLGTVVWSQGQEPSAVDVRSLELAAHVVGLLILKENATADAADRLSGELLTELIVSSPDVTATQRARALSRGIELDALDMVVVVDSALTAADAVRHLHAIAREHSGLAGEHLGRATMLVPAEDPEQLVQDLQVRLRRSLGAPVAVIGERVRSHDWGRAFSRATRCLAVARHLGAADLGATTERFALYAMVFDVERKAELERFLEESIGPLLRYDAQRSTDLVTTLEAYFDNDGNLRRTAGALHVHLNTLLKRLDRISSVLDRDWRGGDDLHLRLAVRLESLRRALRS
jgi:GAF domain-containing protein